MSEIDQSIAHWISLADTLERRISEGYSICPQADRAKAGTYRRTAQALELEKQTGIWHCVCCLKPKGV
jgi:hypothetical protein